MTVEKTIPSWGYHKTKEAQIFDLAEGEKLPKGWADTPAVFEEKLGGSERVEKQSK